MMNYRPDLRVKVSAKKRQSIDSLLTFSRLATLELCERENVSVRSATSERGRNNINNILVSLETMTII